MIRESIARHMSGEGERGSSARGSSFGFIAGHPSHARLPLASGGELDDGVCLIEPTVRCNHCGYCISVGH